MFPQTFFGWLTFASADPTTISCDDTSIDVTVSPVSSIVWTGCIRLDRRSQHLTVASDPPDTAMLEKCIFVVLCHICKIIKMYCCGENFVDEEQKNHSDLESSLNLTALTVPACAPLKCLTTWPLETSHRNSALSAPPLKIWALSQEPTHSRTSWPCPENVFSSFCEIDNIFTYIQVRTMYT